MSYNEIKLINKFLNMLLLSSSSLKWYGLHKIFILAKKAWYDGINLDVDKTNFDTIDEDYIKDLQNEFGISVLSITAQDKWMDEKKIDKLVKMAEVLNSQLISFFPPHITDKKTDWFSKYLPNLSKKLSISLAVANVPAKFWLFVIPEFRTNALQEIKKVTGNTVLNIANIDKSTWIDIMKALSVLGSSIKNVYLSDKNWPKEWLLPGLAGWGTSYLPLESFLMKLKTSNYNWFITLSVNPKELEVWDDVKVLENLEQVKKYYKKHFLDYKA